MRRLVLEHEPEATLSGGALGDQIHAPQFSAVGRDWGQLFGRRRLAAPRGVRPAAVAAVPSEAAAVVFRKRRRSNSRALFSPITNPPVDSLYLRDLLALYPSGLARNA